MFLVKVIPEKIIEHIFTDNAQKITFFYVMRSLYDFTEKFGLLPQTLNNVAAVE